MSILSVGAVMADKHDAPQEPAPVYWAGDVPAKDIVGYPLTSIFYDAKIPDGQWAILSHASFLGLGCKLGTGLGQKYRKQADGRWLKVKG